VCYSYLLLKKSNTSTYKNSHWCLKSWPSWWSYRISLYSRGYLWIYSSMKVVWYRVYESTQGSRGLAYNKELFHLSGLKEGRRIIFGLRWCSSRNLSNFSLLKEFWSYQKQRISGRYARSTWYGSKFDPRITVSEIHASMIFLRRASSVSRGFFHFIAFTVLSRATTVISVSQSFFASVR
jgi:hypothetical protein